MVNSTRASKVRLKKSATFAPKIRAVGQRRTWRGDFYHFVLGRSWWGLTTLVFTGFVLTNAAFGLAYILVPGSIVHARPGSFLDAFFFSVQTMTTIGYGDMLPGTLYAHILVTVEAFAGVVAFALVAGVTFAKFSRPTAKVLFSDHAVVSRRDGVPYLMFRMANWRHNEIVQAELSIVLMVSETTAEGESMRRLIDLPLERDRTPLFTLTWTALHKIDGHSPFFGPDALSRLKAKNAELFLSLHGTDERLAQSVHARHSYSMDDVVTDARFADVLTVLPSGLRIIDYHKFHQVVPLDIGDPAVPENP